LLRVCFTDGSRRRAHACQCFTRCFTAELKLVSDHGSQSSTRATTSFRQTTKGDKRPRGNDNARHGRAARAQIFTLGTIPYASGPVKNDAKKILSNRWAGAAHERKSCARHTRLASHC